MSGIKEIRLANELDSTSLLEIYAPFIKNTVITFEYDIPTTLEFSNRIHNVSEKFPWLVCGIDGKIVGYAYASKHRERAAYQWSADFSIYVSPDYHGRKIGTALYYSLYEMLKLQGYFNAYVGITLPNIKSESFHKAFGFVPVGIYHNVGYKFDKWHDVGWFELRISEYPKIPVPPKIISEIKNEVKFSRIIDNSIEMIKD